MFTGLVQSLGVVRELVHKPDGAGVRLVVESVASWFEAASIRMGDSICVSGVCLTVAAEPESRALADTITGQESVISRAMLFDVHTETIDKTSLGSLRVRSPVNLETSATLATPLGGHMVQGHVEGVARIVKILTTPDWRMTIAPPKDLLECIIPKGSICVEGISLTVASVDLASGNFDVALIPTTLAKTTLGTARVDDVVNIETDIMARTVVYWLRHFQVASAASSASIAH